MWKPKRDSTPVVHTGIVADVGFMLLVFFLVATTLEKDQGIDLKMQPWAEEFIPVLPSEIPIAFKIDINSSNELMANEQIIAINELKMNCRLFILNHIQEGLYPVIEFRVNRSSSYDVYMAALNEIVSTFNELWNEESQRLYNTEYKKINKERKKKIRTMFPMILIELNYDFNPNAF